MNKLEGHGHALCKRKALLLHRLLQTIATKLQYNPADKHRRA